MLTIAKVLVGAVALIHFGIAVVEIFFWPQLERVHKKLGFTTDGAQQAAKVVANAGLYNLFLAVGLLWGLSRGVEGYQIQLFFLGCVFVAGLFGAVTLRWTTLLMQSLPAVLAVLAILASRH